VHIKQMDPAVVALADRDGLAFGQAYDYLRSVGIGAPAGTRPAIRNGGDRR